MKEHELLFSNKENNKATMINVGGGGGGGGRRRLNGRKNVRRCYVALATLYSFDI